jgi:hypothetical protein
LLLVLSQERAASPVLSLFGGGTKKVEGLATKVGGC